MPIGPFDRRKKRSRCVRCVASHRKCSGNSPCSNCEHRGLVCKYSATNTDKSPILVDRGKQQTISTFGAPTKDSEAGTEILRLTRSPKLDTASFYFYYFDVFLRKNKFTGDNSSSEDVGRLLGQSTSGSYLADAMLSLGAMESIKLRSCDGPSWNENNRFALNSYAKSVTGLRYALEHEIDKPQLRHKVLWTTLFLGLFELMNDSTGRGWLQHIVHGTSTALVASGPAACQSGLGRRFFMEVKVFEVCRAIVFNQPSFLARPEWTALSTSPEGVPWHPLDAILDIIVMCTTLRARANDLIDSREKSLGNEERLLGEAFEVSLEGFNLREALHNWGTTTNRAVVSPQNTEDTISSMSSPADDEFLILAEIFYAATSIYLSGVYDYEIAHWEDLGILVSTLSESEIQIHVKSILDLSHVVLECSSISSLLLLFPLRVAGARSREVWQQECIIRLLTKVEATFAVAATFRFELKKLWKSKSESETP
ncbi:hypothetical protein G7046_g7390 [Stylonectria norvegica]|nr:hypothetical protein G7046_g7390 [Stylonectria norvegica]